MFKKLKLISSQNAGFCTAVIIAGWLSEGVTYKLGLSFGNLYKVLVIKQYSSFFTGMIQLMGWVCLLCCLKLAIYICECILEQLWSMGCSKVLAWSHVYTKFSNSEAAQKIVQDSSTLSKSLVKNIVLCTASPPALIWYCIQVVIYGGAWPLLIIFAMVLASHAVAIYVSKYIKKWSKICSSSLSQVRDYSAWNNGRDIVVASGGNLELDNFYKLADINGYNHMKLGLAEGLFSFWINACQYLGGVLPYIILGWLIFVKNDPMDLELMINFNFLVQKLMFLCQGLLTIWDEVAKIRAMWQRLSPTFDEPAKPPITLHPEICLCWSRCKCTVNDLSLSENWSGSIEFGQIVCIYGPPGVGKTSWVRQIAGINTVGSFSIHPNHMIVTARPVFTMGHFLEQITYPKRRKANDPILTCILNRIPCLQKFVTVKRDWANCLSPGEKQWINVARILYHSPVVLIWDDYGCHFDKNLFEVVMSIFNHAKAHDKSVICISNDAIPYMTNIQFGVDM